ncbi:hypothetical protein M9Y10_023864 [Tritrichomonas musculus]|uniref:Protein kinase domain-containing protein n=1 Tax=Tritrichomonas musculus TaxID=1915356 RepID=A0ABR2KX66_9EUKA
MLKLCGNNNRNQLGEESNNKSPLGFPVINPAVNSHLEASTLISFSNYGNKTVVITTDGILLAAGSIPGTFLTKFTKIEIKNNYSIQHPISAVCGWDYTLYMVSPSKTDDTRLLAYSSDIIKTASPLFLNIGKWKPVSLFGGRETAAAIDDEGAIIFVPNSESIAKSPSTQLSRFHLQEGEKAKCLACCTDFICAVGSSGRVFESEISRGSSLSFKITESLKGIKIAEISGVCNHCLAVSEDGRVFSRGYNYCGELGIGKGKGEPSKFFEISSLSGHRISHAYAGCLNSLFQTVEGELFECGSNKYCQLFSRKPSNDLVYLPVNTGLTEKATFCVEGYYTSAVFIGHDPIQSPNRRIIEETDELDEVARLSAENAILKEENGSLKNTIKELNEKVKKLTTPLWNSNFEPFEQETINKMKHYEVIGRGSQSEVVKVAREEEFALKILLVKEKTKKAKSAGVDLSSVQHLLHEFEILHQLHHPNIIEAFGFSYGDETHAPSILLQLCPHSLSDIVDDMTDIEKVCSIYEISLGMSAVHAAGLIHRDLKPSNILIDSKKHVRVSDFGVSCVSSVESQMESMTGGVGTIKFMAPELLNELSSYSNKVDVYSFGVVVFFILTGGELPKISLMEQGNGKKAKIPKEINEVSRDLILRCWSTNAEDRPSFSEIVEFINSKKFSLIDGVEKDIDVIKKFLSI